jgi:hypothetical protein
MSNLGYRENIIGLLRDISNLSDLVGPDEMVCQWSDDLYLPGADGSGLEPGVHDRGIAEFRALFSADELAAMAKFHTVFEEAFPALSRDPRSFQRDLGWRTIANRAKEALVSFGD